ncbi:hypothetical protein ABVT39_027215 [Epinephelus coioides]
MAPPTPFRATTSVLGIFNPIEKRFVPIGSEAVRGCARVTPPTPLRATTSFLGNLNPIEKRIVPIDSEVVRGHPRVTPPTPLRATLSFWVTSSPFTLDLPNWPRYREGAYPGDPSHSVFGYFAILGHFIPNGYGCPSVALVP